MKKRPKRLLLDEIRSRLRRGWLAQLVRQQPLNEDLVVEAIYTLMLQSMIHLLELGYDVKLRGLGTLLLKYDDRRNRYNFAHQMVVPRQPSIQLKLQPSRRLLARLTKILIQRDLDVEAVLTETLEDRRGR